MEKVYDLHQHTHCVIMHIGKTEFTTYIFSTSNRRFYFPSIDAVKLDSFISYNKQRTEVTSSGCRYEERGEDDIIIDDFRDGLYNLFKKDKAFWNEKDNFFMKAVSDFLPYVIELAMEKKGLEIESFDLFHYAFIVPSEWEEEIRDGIFRPIFVQSGLISKEDHQDRLLFFTDIEAIFYHHSFERGQNTILCRVTPEEEGVIVKLDLVQTTNTLFNIPNAKLFPKVMNSNSVSFNSDDIQDRIRDFLRAKLFSVATTDYGGLGNSIQRFCQDQIIKAIIERINSENFPSLDQENEEKDPEKEPWIIFKKRWMLSETQKEFIKSLCPSIICADIGTFLLDYVKRIISNNFTKRYKIMLVVDHYSDQGYRFKTDVMWLKYILEYNIRPLNSIVAITQTDSRLEPLLADYILEGAGEGVFDAIQHSDIYCKPRIVPSVDLPASSSVFINSKPDAIINLDISLGLTLFMCSILDENGLIQQIFDHDYFTKDKHLPPLGCFYRFSNTTKLNVKEKFIPFAERYLVGDLSDFTLDDDVATKNDILLEMKALLTKDLSEGEVLVSIDRQKYSKAFILMYMIYIKEEILYKLLDQSVSDQRNIKVGYAVSIETMLLNYTVESKDNLRDIIYASGLVSKDDTFKKLRITTQGERILPAIQKSLKLELSLKSYFLLCQLHEDYVQLSLHQVVTASNSEEKEQESIIVQDEILAIQNIYDSLCSNMWYNLQQDSRLIEMCEIHNTADNNKILDIFSSETKTEFFANLKGHISDNVLHNNPRAQSVNTVMLTKSCNCKVRVTISDIIDISFTPVLQDIACTLYASLLNKELFGNYINIDYLFSFIRFNNNSQLQRTFARILEEEADDFNLELGIDTTCLAVLELFNQLLQPVIAQNPFCYKDFKTGALQQVCSENYVVFISQNEYKDASLVFKSEPTDTETSECGYNIAFPVLNKGSIINNIRENRIFYLQNKKDWMFNASSIGVYRFRTMNYLRNNETLSLDDNICERVDKVTIQFKELLRWKDVEVPVMISISYLSYTSSLQFSVRFVGAEMRHKKIMGIIETGEPLTLSRF